MGAGWVEQANSFLGEGVGVEMREERGRGKMLERR